MTEILDEVASERHYQRERSGDAFDDKNTSNDWISYIVRYASNACSSSTTKEEFEIAMIEVAAIAVAAVETSRRNNGLPVRHYD